VRRRRPSPSGMDSGKGFDVDGLTPLELEFSKAYAALNDPVKAARAVGLPEEAGLTLINRPHVSRYLRHLSAWQCLGAECASTTTLIDLCRIGDTRTRLKAAVALGELARLSEARMSAEYAEIGKPARLRRRSRNR